MTVADIDRSERVAAAIRTVWGSVLPTEPFDPAISWRDAGVDSLKGLEIALRIEQETGIPVPFHLMTQDVTLGEFIRLLSGPRREPPAATESMFLVPGIYGDGPGLADFRAELAASARIEVVALPSLDSSVGLLGRLDRTAAEVVEQILHRQPAGDVRLLGYSYGAFVAQEAARQLEAAGRRVSFLCLLDGGGRLKRRHGGMAPPAGSPPPDVRLRRELLAINALCRIGLWEIAHRRVLAARSEGDWQRSEMARRIFLTRLRTFSILRHRFRPCAAPTLLIASADFNLSRAMRLWRSVCPDLRVDSIAAGHVDMFDRPALLDVKAHVLDGWRWAQTRPPSGST